MADKEGRLHSLLGNPPLVAAFTLGFSSLIAQLLALREFVASLGGNELVIGTFLASSLLLTAAGAWTGRLPRLPRLGLASLLVISIPLPAAQVAAIRWLRGWLATGSAPSLETIFACAALVLLPTSLTFGFLFSRAASWGGSRALAGRVYLAETLGAVGGGAAYTLASGFYAPVLALASLPAAASAAASAIILWHGGAGRKSLVVLASTSGLIAALLVPGATRLTLRYSFPGQQIVREVDSPYGDLVLTRTGEQLNLFSNGLPVSSSETPGDPEQIVHFAMAQRPDARRVLILGGVASGATNEALKYPVHAVDDVEVDAALRELAEAVSGVARDPRLRVMVADARQYARASRQSYDVIISAAPDPATTTLNRLFTLEFFTELKRILTPGGVVSFTIAGSENYRGVESRELNRALATTLAAVFPHTLVLPAGRLVFLGSTGALRADIVDSLQARGIQTAYVNRAYMQAHLAPERVARLAGELKQPGRLNRDLEPSVYQLYLKRWLAELGGSALWLGVALLLGGALFIRGSLAGPGAPVRLAILTSGFSSLSLEFCLLLAFQMIHGSLFLQMGVMIGAYMLGNALGAAAAIRCSGDGGKIRLLRHLELTNALAAAGLAAGFGLMPSGNTSALGGPFLFSTLLALIGFLTGAEYPLAVGTLQPVLGQAASKLYAADLAGAAIGAATAGVILVPLLGIWKVCVLVAATKAAAFAVLVLGQPASLRAAQVGTAEWLPIGPWSLLLLAASALLVIAPGTEMAIYSLSFRGSYHALLLLLLFLGLLLSLNLRTGGRRPLGPAVAPLREAWMRMLRRGATSRPAQFFNLALFSLPTFYPLARCYFQVPYLFCHACPRVCVFGYLRPFWVPAAFLMNLGSYSWCRQMCPLGGAFEPAGGRRVLGRWSRRLGHGFRFCVLIFVAYSYFAMPAGAANESPLSTDLYSVLFKNAYSVSLIVLAVTAGLLVLNRWVPKSFCNLLCPVGASCDLAHGLLRRIPAGREEPAIPAAERDDTC